MGQGRVDANAEFDGYLDEDEEDDSELMDAILDGVATVSITATLKMDDVGRWRILRQPRDTDDHL
jgi:hypothetical protein